MSTSSSRHRRGVPPDPVGGSGERGWSGSSALLLTVEQAATLLQVRPSWLARKATARAVACTFVGKHLRFSHADLHAIIAAGATGPGQPPAGGRPGEQLR